MRFILKEIHGKVQIKNIYNLNTLQQLVWFGDSENQMRQFVQVFRTMMNGSMSERPFALETVSADAEVNKPSSGDVTKITLRSELQAPQVGR